MNLSSRRISPIVAAALLAACSGTSQPLTTLPNDAAGSPASAVRAEHLSAAGLIRLQAEGRLPAIAPPWAMRRILKYMESRKKPRIVVRHRASTVGMWASNIVPGMLLGQTSGGNTTVETINTESSGCDFPTGLKVDHSQNLWAACEYDTTTESGGVLEYKPNGALLGKYLVGCPGNAYGGCHSIIGYGFDVAENSSAVFAPLSYYELTKCNYNSPPSCSYIFGSGFEYWPAGSPSSLPTLIQLDDNYDQCSEVCSIYFADVDNSGNLWFTYYGCTSISFCGAGLGEVTNPTSASWKFKEIFPAGFFTAVPGGVYVSQRRNVYSLNVVDPTNRQVLQYHLPVTSSSKPYRTLGPTALNALGLGEPISGGFNESDSMVALADAFEWLDVGKVTPNTWKAVSSPNFNSGVAFMLNSAAYTPSDK